MILRRIDEAVLTAINTVRWYLVGSSMLIRHVRDHGADDMRIWDDVDALRLRYGLKPRQSPPQVPGGGSHE